MTTSTTSIDIMGLQAAYANLHTDQERDYVMQRYHDIISSFGGNTSCDAHNRPLRVMRSNLWASGYDVDGTDQTSLGQFHQHRSQMPRDRSEERFSRNAETDLVCRLLLEKKNGLDHPNHQRKQYIDDRRLWIAKP